MTAGPWRSKGPRGSSKGPRGNSKGGWGIARGAGEEQGSLGGIGITSEIAIYIRMIEDFTRHWEGPVENRNDEWNC